MKGDPKSFIEVADQIPTKPNSKIDIEVSKSIAKQIGLDLSDASFRVSKSGEVPPQFDPVMCKEARQKQDSVDMTVTLDVCVPGMEYPLPHSLVIYTYTDTFELRRMESDDQVSKAEVKQARGMVQDHSLEFPTRNANNWLNAVSSIINTNAIILLSPQKISVKTVEDSSSVHASNNHYDIDDLDIDAARDIISSIHNSQGSSGNNQSNISEWS